MTLKILFPLFFSKKILRAAGCAALALLVIGAVGAGRGRADSPDGAMEGLHRIAPADRAAVRRAAGHRDTGILVTDDQGTILFAKDVHIPQVPASTLKILTSLAALTHLGPDFRFVTPAAYDPATQTLHVQGRGDPLFVSEAIQGFCRQIVEQTGRQPLHTIAVDQGYFAPNITIPGTGRTLNPYDATTGALCANFNTLNFTRDPATGQIRSAEPQTPLLDRFLPAIRRTGLSRGRILVDKAVQPVYPGLLMARFFRDLGVDVTGPVTLGPFPDPAPAVISLTSPWPLDQVVAKLLRYSNNFIANQVMLALGARIYGPPATLEKGVSILRKTAETLPGWETAHLAEGSGISRKNRVTPAQMGQLLLAFMPHHRLLQAAGTQYYKTGTLTGIRTRAGYFIGTDGRLYPFVIMGSVPYF
jgi:D-alanyl-D-alanine carboxypeptidase/D-alanyl-D-alanine-endopeptidase (penicillin-binding protein 4)